MILPAKGFWWVRWQQRDWQTGEVVEHGGRVWLHIREGRVLLRDEVDVNQSVTWGPYLGFGPEHDNEADRKV